MDSQGSKRVEVAGVGDKWMITAVLTGSLVGDFLPVQVIYQGKTDQPLSAPLRVPVWLEHHSFTQALV